MNACKLTTIAAAATLCLTLPELAVADAAPAAESLAEGEREPGASLSDCVKVRSEARYGAYGYDHIVELENTCAKTVTCSVVTNVNKQPSEVTIAPNTKASVTTFRGSPAREFKADVSCKAAS